MIGHLKLSVFLVALLVSAQVIAQDVPADQKPKTTTTVAPPNTTTTAAPKTTTPTPPPTTTTSTVAPTVAPTPSPTPKKPFPANEGKWEVVDEKNVTCILFKGALELVISYQDTENKNRSANVDIPISANASGSCSNTNVQTLILTWPTVVENGTRDNTVTFSFESNSTAVLEAGDGISADKYGIQNITMSIYKDPSVFINDTADTDPMVFGIFNKAAFQTPLNHSYRCLAQEALKSDDGKVTLKFSDVRAEAFRRTAAGHQEFSASIDCPADDASDLVPIAVGAALATLVVIVLIAYLIGRRRNRARGYQSV